MDLLCWCGIVWKASSMTASSVHLQHLTLHNTTLHTMSTTHNQDLRSVQAVGSRPKAVEVHWAVRPIHRWDDHCDEAVVVVPSLPMDSFHPGSPDEKGGWASAERAAMLSIILYSFHSI